MRHPVQVWAGAAVVAAAVALGIALSPPATGQNPVSLTVSAPSYPELVRKAEQLARQKVAALFKSSQVQIARVTVNGKNGSSVAPVLDIQIARADWNKKPRSLLGFSNYYNVAGLLGYNLAPAVASNPTDSAETAPSANPTEKKSGQDSGEASAKTSGPLKLEKSAPPDGEERFSIRKPVELTFARELPVKTGEDLGLRLEPEVQGTTTVEKTRVVFTPATTLAYSRQYTLTIAGSKKLKIPGPLSVRFKTEPQYTYTKDIRPILAGTCTSCHSLRGTARTSPLDSYVAVLQYVTPGQGGQILDYTGYHGQTRTGAFGGFANAAPPGSTPPGPPSNPNVNRNRRSSVATTTPPPDTTTDGTTTTTDDDSAVPRTSLTRGGALNDQQVALLRTWILQDQAVEK